jgi:hypothetical protein
MDGELATTTERDERKALEGWDGMGWSVAWSTKSAYE